MCDEAPKSNEPVDLLFLRYYGCGLAIPAKLEGMKILDLGSGSGRDCFAASKLVGQEGGVVGIDMTEELVHVYHARIQRGGGRGVEPSMKNHKNIGFLSNTGPAPMQNHKA